MNNLRKNKTWCHKNEKMTAPFAVTRCCYYQDHYHCHHIIIMMFIIIIL